MIKQPIEREQTFSYPKVLIAGYGIVGANIHRQFPFADIYDKFKSSNWKPSAQYDFCFICVPTPMNTDGSADISAVEDIFECVNTEIFVLKSTVPPGTTGMLTKKYSSKIVFSPEYDGNTQHAKTVQNFVILGGERISAETVANLYSLVKDGSFRVCFTDFLTAELVKYMENAFLASKVIFCNEFYRIANRLGVNYGELRELFLMDSRVNRSHTLVYPQAPYYDSKCLNKDLPAIVRHMESRGYTPSFLQSIIDTNERFKNENNV